MVFQAACNYAIMSWGPTYFIRIHGWTAGQAGRALAVIMIVFAWFGDVLGRISERSMAKKGIADGPIRVALDKRCRYFHFPYSGDASFGCKVDLWS